MAIPQAMTIADSSTMAEYIAVNESAKEIAFIRNVMHSLGCTQKVPTPLYIDNMGAFFLSRNPILHNRSKHFDIKYHKIREYINEKVVDTQKCSTKDMTADIFTKALTPVIFRKHMLKLFNVGT